jgi:transglutaminase-like putative cysteine protease
MNLAGRRALRLRLRDFAAGAAFASVALSGVLPAWALAAFAASFGASLLGLRPLSGRRVWAAGLLLLVALLLVALVWVGAMDLILAAVSFATLVTGHRLISEPTSATDQQVLLSSLLLMAGGATLTGELWYAVCLLAFGVFACLTLGLAVVEGPVEREELFPLPPVLRQVTLGVGLALVGGIAFFILFPRLSWNMSARHSGPGLLGATTGMSESVNLGGAGTLKTSTRVVLRARLSPDPGSAELERYWLGRSFDAFDGREWKATGVELAPQGTVWLDDFAGPRVRQEIELTPAYDAHTLVALDPPFSFGDARALTPGQPVPTPVAKVPGQEARVVGTGNAWLYNAESGQLSRRKGVPAQVDARYLRLPESLDPRVAALAAQVVGSETDPGRVAQALERYLQQTYAYSLELNGQAADPLADFLFEARRGHCEHFATALTVMLRARGVPARVATGFFGGERIADRYVLHAGDAHAWAQAFIPGRGWISFDATPEAGRGSQSNRWLAWATGVLEWLEMQWSSRVVDYTIQDQVNFVRGLVRPPRPAQEEAPAPEALPQRAIPVAMAVTLSVLGLGWWLTRKRPGAPHPAAAFLDELDGALAHAGVSRQPGEPTEELAQRLARTAHPLAAPVGRATRRYLEARFGAQPLSKAERQALLAAVTSGAKA